MAKTIKNINSKIDDFFRDIELILSNWHDKIF